MILVDTSALYAVLDRDDRNHAAASATWRTLLQGDEALLVTSYILVETTALVQHRLGMEPFECSAGTFCRRSTFTGSPSPITCTRRTRCWPPVADS